MHAARPTNDGAKPPRGRSAPASGSTAEAAAEPPTTQRAFDIGNGAVAIHVGDESWGVVGQTVKLHDSFWGLAENEYSECKVVGYMGAHQFATGARSRHTYVVECEDHFYPARHSTICTRNRRRSSQTTRQQDAGAATEGPASGCMWWGHVTKFRQLLTSRGDMAR